MTREELDAIRNHMSNLPTVGAMYAPVLVEWVAVLLRQRDEVTAQRDNLLDASKEGAWMARALDAERERDKARKQHDALWAVWVAASDWLNHLEQKGHRYNDGVPGELMDAVSAADDVMTEKP